MPKKSKSFDRPLSNLYPVKNHIIGNLSGIRSRLTFLSECVVSFKERENNPSESYGFALSECFDYLSLFEEYVPNEGDCPQRYSKMQDYLGFIERRLFYLEPLFHEDVRPKSECSAFKEVQVILEDIKNDVRIAESGEVLREREYSDMNYEEHPRSL